VSRESSPPPGQCAVRPIPIHHPGGPKGSLKNRWSAGRLPFEARIQGARPRIRAQFGRPFHEMGQGKPANTLARHRRSRKRPLRLAVPPRQTQTNLVWRRWLRANGALSAPQEQLSRTDDGAPSRTMGKLVRFDRQPSPRSFPRKAGNPGPRPSNSPSRSNCPWGPRPSAGTSVHCQQSPLTTRCPAAPPCCAWSHLSPRPRRAADFCLWRAQTINFQFIVGTDVRRRPVPASICGACKSGK